MTDPELEVYWSRSLARAFSEYNPTPKVRIRLNAALQAAKSEKDLPVWFLDFVNSGSIKN